MSFQEQSETIQSRLHLGKVRPSILIALIALSAALLAGLVVMVGSYINGHSVSISNGSKVEADESLVLTPTVDESQHTPQASGNTTSVEEPVYYCVHVSGSVVSPGVYYLEEGSRVHDAILAAGGLSAEAHPDYINEARLISDGEHIVVPSKDDIAQAAASAGEGWASLEEQLNSAKDNSVVNINTAGVEELTTLNGIGEATAEKIVADREANGTFKSIEDLKRVSGIGDKKFEALADGICV